MVLNIDAFLLDLAANPSRKYKVEQLEHYHANTTLREVVRLALDPFTQFYQRKIPPYVQNNKKPPPLFVTLDEALLALRKLSQRIVTGHEAISYLAALLEAVSANDAKVLERILQKDLKCGVQIATANTVWKNLVMDYPCMLCSPFDLKLVENIKFPAYVQQKMDGMRFNALVVNGKVEYRSRNGKELNLLGQLDAAFLNNVGDYVFDGELLVKDENGLLLDRQTGNGILNKATRGTLTLKEASLVQAMVWDIIPYADFVKGVCKMPYRERYAFLHKVVQQAPPQGISCVPITLVASFKEAQDIFDDYLQKGYEGIILKDANGPWEDKRAKHQIKFKGELECDLKIVGLEEGVGKYANMVGALVCASADNLLKVNVGSGLTDAQRQSFGAELIGKIVTIKYNARIKNKGHNEESLFLPIFVEIRADKDKADNAADIQ
jgi:hypothetical protein